MNRTYKYGTYLKAIVFGIVTKVGELRAIGRDATPHIDFTVKTVEYYKAKNAHSVLKEFTKWHQCRAFGKMAQHIDSMGISRGDLVKVDGSFDYARATDMSSAINQSVTIKVSSFNLILENAERDVSEFVEEQEDGIEPQFDFEPIEIPTGKTDVQ